MMIKERGLILFFEQYPIFSALLTRKSFLWSIISVRVNYPVVMWGQYGLCFPPPGDKSVFVLGQASTVQPWPSVSPCMAVCVTLHIIPDCLLPFFPPPLPLSFLLFSFLFGLKFRITKLSMNRVKQCFRNRWVKFCLMNIYFFINPIDDFMTPYFTNFACTNTLLNNSLCIR